MSGTMPTALPPVVKTALDAANSGDRLAFLGCFAPDGAVDDWGRHFTGPEAISEWSKGEFIGVDVSLRVLDASTRGDVTTVKAQVGGSGFTGPSIFTFTVQVEQIMLMAITA